MKTIKQVIEFPCSPSEAFECFMDEKKHAAFTGGKAKISREVGGSFTIFDGWASGKNIEIIEGKKIVQSWRSEDFPEDQDDSIVSFSFAPSAHNPKHCTLTFSHKHLPDSLEKELAQGWNDYYWKPLKAYFESK